MRTIFILSALALSSCADPAADQSQFSAHKSSEEVSQTGAFEEEAGGSDADTSVSTPTSGGYSSGSYSDDEEFDEEAARDEAEDDLSSEAYDYSYGCTEDCSGHQAGRDYQAQEGYGSYPSGNSRSFEEGRVAFDEAVDERVEEMRSEWESDQSE